MSTQEPKDRNATPKYPLIGPDKANEPAEKLSTINSIERKDFSLLNRYKSIVTAIDTEILPILASRGDPLAKSWPANEAVWLANAVLSEDFEGAKKRLCDLWQADCDPVEILEDIIGGAASLMGKAWCEDRMNFNEVSMAILNLRRLVHFLSETKLNHSMENVAGHILIAPVYGETHLLGMEIISCIFRHHGWDVVTVESIRSEELSVHLQYNKFDIIGFSISAATAIDSLKTDIRHLRQAYSPESSCPPVVLGGALDVNDQLSIFEDLEIAGIAATAKGSMDLALSLLD